MGQSPRQPRRRRSPSRQRRGALTVELVLTLPILLAVLVATILFGQWMMSQQAIQAAASVGAREATLPGATETRVQEVVEAAVDGWRFDGHLDPVEITIDGTPAASGDLAAAPTGAVIEVRVSVDANKAVPDLLNVFSTDDTDLSIVGKKISATYVMRKE